MILILTFMVFLTLFLIVIDFFSILFRLTGVPIEKARFQVISLLCSTGYTTKESEIITQHPTRRRLASWLMIVSYVSTATFISFVVNIITSSILDISSFVIIIFFIVFIFFFHKSSLLEKIENALEKAIEKNERWKRLNNINLTLISKNKGYGIYEIYLPRDSFLIGRSILNSGLKEKEIQVLSIDKGDKLVNFPRADYIFDYFDKITVYGNLKSVKTTFKHIIK